MWLIVGLGNPGTKYQVTRHNVGFTAVDFFARGYESGPWKDEHQALTTRVKMDDELILLAKPQTFMNLSGESVQALMTFYKIPIDKLLVLHDEIEIGFGLTRFHKNRGHGGHNGIRNISEKLGPDYTRLKLGVGRPAIPEMSVADYVLQKFSEDEMNRMPDFMNRAGDAIEYYIANGLQKASSQYNQ